MSRQQVPLAAGLRFGGRDGHKGTGTVRAHQFRAIGAVPQMARPTYRKMKNKLPIFRDLASKSMWDDINNADTLEKLQMALYVVACRCQELEHKVEHLTQTRRSRKTPARLKKHAT